MKKYKWESLLILIITIVLMWIILKNNFKTSINLIFSSNLLWIALAILVFIIQFLIEAYIIYLLIKEYNKDYTYHKTIKLNFITKFFNGITPFSSGGQPFQIIELTKDGLSVSNAAIVIVEDFIFLQISVIIMGIISFIISIMFNLFDFSSFLWNMTTLGFIINLLILIVVFWICKHMKPAKKVGEWIVKFLSKIKLIKNRDAAIEKWGSTCVDYSNGFIALQKNKKLVRKCLILNIIYMLIYFMVPFFIFKAVGDTKLMNIFLCVLLSFYIFLCGSYIPLPGGTFGIEYSFMHYYAFIINDLYLSPALIIWRFLTYYLPMILGGVFYNIKKRRDLRYKTEEAT